MRDHHAGSAPLPIVSSHEAGLPDTPDAIFLPDGAREWALWAACDACGGYALGLRVRSPERDGMAARRAEAFLRLVHRRGCLRCDAQRRRAEPAAPDEGLWWDPERDDWMLDGQMPGGETVRMPLDVGDYWAVPEAAAAAAALATDGAPVRAVTGLDAVDVDVPAIFHAGRWRMWLPCDDCGGAELPLRETDRLAAAEAAGRARRVVELAAREGCPACTARGFRRRTLPPDCPAIAWYDPETDAWMLWRSVEGTPDGVTLPLGIDGYDADRVVLEGRIEQQLFEDG